MPKRLRVRKRIRPKRAWPSPGRVAVSWSLRMVAVHLLPCEADLLLRRLVLPLRRGMALAHGLEARAGDVLGDADHLVRVVIGLAVAGLHLRMGRVDAADRGEQ